VKPIEQQAEGEDIAVWTMYFDGASTRDSAGSGVVLISHTKETISLLLGPHIVPFLPILLAIILPFITYI
jgi:hypothetical protein